MANYAAENRDDLVRVGDETSDVHRDESLRSYEQQRDDLFSVASSALH